MKKIGLVFCLLLLSAVFVIAQPRVIEKKSEKSQIPPAPEQFKAKYEGGVIGFSKNEDGTLKFDDINLRLVFFDKENKEKFGLSYDSLLAIFPNSKSVQSTAGKIIDFIPYGQLASQFIKEKRRYMIVNFNDTDVDIRGTVNFRLESAELVDSVIESLAKKAELKKRGDAYFRPKKENTESK